MTGMQKPTPCSSSPLASSLVFIDEDDLAPVLRLTGFCGLIPISLLPAHGQGVGDTQTRRLDAERTGRPRSHTRRALTGSSAQPRAAGRGHRPASGALPAAGAAEWSGVGAEPQPAPAAAGLSRPGAGPVPGREFPSPGLRRQTRRIQRQSQRQRRTPAAEEAAAEEGGRDALQAILWTAKGVPEIPETGQSLTSWRGPG
jgi:hypothetical protein